MKIRRVRHYAKPDYPGMAEAMSSSGGFRNHVPRRWEQLPWFTVLLGLLAMSEVRADADAVKPAAVQAPEAQKPKTDRTDAADAVHSVTSIVAPLLDEALRHDGRGAIGCLAINPPTFLPEDEAIEIIREEIKRTGLEMTEFVEMDNILSPTGDDSIYEEKVIDENGDESFVGRSRTDDDPPPRVSSQPYTFDLANLRQTIYIKYLSRRDYMAWAGHSMSTLTVYDFPKVSQRVAEAFSRHQSGPRTVFGVFFDPLAHAGTVMPDTTGLTSEQCRLAHSEYHRALKIEHEGLNAKSKEKLRKQVRHFVEFLRQEGVVGKGE